MAQHGYSSSRPANRFRCDEEHCSATFSRHADLQRHLDEKDPKPCTVQGCFYMWRRRARLDKHLRNNHSGFFYSLNVPEDFSGPQTQQAPYIDHNYHPLNHESSPFKQTTTYEMHTPDHKGEDNGSSSDLYDISDLQESRKPCEETSSGVDGSTTYSDREGKVTAQLGVYVPFVSHELSGLSFQGPAYCMHGGRSYQIPEPEHTHMMEENQDDEDEDAPHEIDPSWQ